MSQKSESTGVSPIIMRLAATVGCGIAAALLAASAAAQTPGPLQCGAADPSAYAFVYAGEMNADCEYGQGDDRVLFSVAWKGCHTVLGPSFGGVASNSVSFGPDPTYGGHYVTLLHYSDPFCRDLIGTDLVANYGCCVKNTGAQYDNVTIGSWSS